MVKIQTFGYNFSNPEAHMHLRTVPTKCNFSTRKTDKKDKETFGILLKGHYFSQRGMICQKSANENTVSCLPCPSMNINKL